MVDVVVAVVVFVVAIGFLLLLEQLPTIANSPGHQTQKQAKLFRDQQQNRANFVVDLRVTCNLEAAEWYRCRRPRNTHQPCTRRHNGPRPRRHVRCEFVLHNAKSVWDATARLYGRRERTSVAQESFSVASCLYLFSNTFSAMKICNAYQHVEKIDTGFRKMYYRP